MTACNALYTAERACCKARAFCTVANFFQYVFYLWIFVKLEESFDVLSLCTADFAAIAGAAPAKTASESKSLSAFLLGSTSGLNFAASKLTY
jgi:hypothetical protein